MKTTSDKEGQKHTWKGKTRPQSGISCSHDVSEQSCPRSGAQVVVQEPEACHFHKNVYNLDTTLFSSQWRSCELAQL